MKYLFDFKKCSQPGKVQHKLIDELQKICQFPDFKSSQSYFRRLLKCKKKNKSKTKPAKKSKSSKKTPKKAKRLIWMQMVPAMIRLQKWIHSTNRNRQEVDDGTKKRKRKRKRKRNHDKTPADPKPATDQKPKPPQKRKRKGKRNNKNDKDKNIEGKKVHHEKLPSFKVVPQNDFSIKHFALDTKSLYDILKNLKAFEEDGKNLYQQNDFMDLDEAIEKTNAKSKNPFWNLLFKVNKFETKTKTFGSFITTNSSDVSIQYCQLRKDRETSREQLIDLAEKWKDQKDNATSDEESDEESESENEYDDASESESESDDEANDKSKKGDVDPDIVEKLQKLNINLENVSISGVDLGIRNTAATVIRTWENSKILESNVLHKAKDYHYKAGFGKRAKLRKKFVGDFDKKYQEDRQSAGEEPSSKSGNYIAYLTSRLKWFNRATDTYMQRRVTNLKFSKFVDTQKEMSQMANEIIGMAKKDAHIVFLGDCSTPSNSPIKGHMRSPTDKKICRFLNQCRNTIVIIVDEFRTTKLCSRCFGELESVESSKDRLKICKKICKSLEDSTPANQISTMRSKQTLNQLLQNVGTKPTQYQRRQRLSMHRSERPSESDRIRIQARKSLRTTTYNGRQNIENGHWNRDINAARNMIYRGLCNYGQYIHQELTFRENTAFSRAPTRE